MLFYGLANRVVPAGEAYSHALELARDIRKYSPEAVAAIKGLLQTGAVMPSAAAASHEQTSFPALWASEVHQSAVANWFQKRSGKSRE